MSETYSVDLPGGFWSERIQGDPYSLNPGQEAFYNLHVGTYPFGASPSVPVTVQITHLKCGVEVTEQSVLPQGDGYIPFTVSAAPGDPNISVGEPSFRVYNVGPFPAA